MSGILYTIEKLGSALAQAESDITQLRQENALLREQLEAKADEPASPRN